MSASASSRRFIHPAGFSPEHTISIAFRLLQDTSREPFALWQLTDEDFQPKMGLVLDREYHLCSSTGISSIPIRGSLFTVLPRCQNFLDTFTGHFFLSALLSVGLVAPPPGGLRENC